MFFQTNYDKIERQKLSYDVISVTPSLLHHRKTSPNYRYKEGIVTCRGKSEVRIGLGCAITHFPSLGTGI